MDDIAVVAKQIVAANLGTVMDDGHRFATPALIEPGWMLNVPVTAVQARPRQSQNLKAICSFRRRLRRGRRRLVLEDRRRPPRSDIACQ
jgi:hypothetical protein